MKKIVLLGMLVVSLFAEKNNSFQLYENGLNHYENKNYSEAIYYFDNACKAKNALACYKLGLIFRRGKGVAVNMSKARSNYTDACNYGYYKSCGMSSKLYMRGDDYDIGSNYKKAVAISEIGCENGYNNSCSNLSELTLFGLGKSQNTQEAIGIMENMCKVDTYPYTCRTVANFYASGKIIKQEDINYFKKSCKKGVQLHCDMYEKSKKIPAIQTNIKKSFDYSVLGCTSKKTIDGKACRVLGDMYNEGGLLSTDKHKADFYYKRCCEGSRLDSPNGQYCCPKVGLPAIY